MKKILVSDDSQFMRKVLRDIIESNKLGEVIEAQNGAEAIALYDEHKPDLVMLDIIMPEVDGTQVLANIVPKGAKAIVITAVGQDGMIEKAKSLGALGYVIKPFEESKVVEEVKKALG